MRNWLLLLASAAISLIAAEIGVRSLLDPVTAMAIWFEPDRSQKAYEWQFLRNTPRHNDSSPSFDPDLGWDTHQSGIRSIATSDAVDLPAPIRVLFIGDPFVFGSEVHPEEAISSQFARNTRNVIAANMGVPGYGIGQSFSKLLKKGLAWSPDIVVFGIHPPNYERTVLRFFSRPKPRYGISADGGQLTIEKPAPETALPAFRDELERKRMTDFFLLGLIRKAFYRLVPAAREQKVAEYFESNDPVIRKILDDTRKAVAEAGAKLFVLQIPHGSKFASKEALERYASRYPVPARLLKIYDELRLNFADLESAFLASDEVSAIRRTYYTHPDGPDSTGHLSVEGNLFAALFLKERICATFYAACPLR